MEASTPCFAASPIQLKLNSVSASALSARRQIRLSWFVALVPPVTLALSKDNSRSQTSSGIGVLLTTAAWSFCSIFSSAPKGLDFFKEIVAALLETAGSMGKTREESGATSSENTVPASGAGSASGVVTAIPKVSLSIPSRD